MARSLHLQQAKPRILVVEDVDDVREMYVEYLSFLGFSVEGAVDGRDAVRKAISHERALIVMDLAMPVLDGWEAIRILRADPRTKAIPIIVLTGQAQPEPIARAKAVGATEVVIKPCLPAQLGRIVVNTLAHNGAGGAET
jgi:CheY-like chemotaxis protein